MRSTPEFAPLAASIAPSTGRLPGFCPAYGLPRVRELPLRLEPVAPDTFGGLVVRSTSVTSAVSLTNHPRGAFT